MIEKIEKSNIEDIFELSKIQKGILFQYLKEENQDLYNVQLSFNIEGTFKVDVLKQSIDIIQSRNEALRSVFRWEKVSKPLQIVLKKYQLDFTFHDLSKKKGDDFLDLLKYYCCKGQNERFDLKKLPVLMQVIKVSNQSFIFNITYHHILFDGWSSGILLKDLFNCYQQLTKYKKPNSNDKPSYKSVYQALRKRNNENREELYWENYLKNYEIIPRFLKDHSGPIGKVQTLKLPCTISNVELQMFTVNHKITKASVIYSAFGILLHKYFNSSDIVYGTTISNRDSRIPDTDKIIGNFINTIPLRLIDPEKKSLLEIVKSVSNDTIERNQFNTTSYFEIKQLLTLKPDENLYESVVAVENYPLEEESININSEFTVELKSVYENTSIPLVVTVFFREKLEIEFMFKENFLNRAYATSLANNFITIIDEILNDSNKKVKSLILSTENDERQFAKEFNDTKAEYPKDKTIIDLFEEQVKKTPKNIALVLGTKVIRYKELKVKSDKIANYMQDVTGVEIGDLVGIMLGREEYLIPTILGILKSGAAYVPIDPKYPLGRINSIIEESSLKVLIKRGQHLNILMNAKLKIVDLDQTLSKILTYQGQLSKVKLNSKNLAYVLYTSGSTGAPKGVMIEHKSLINYISWAAAYYLQGEKAVFPLYTSISFDLTVTSIFVPLVTGNRIIIYEDVENNLVIKDVIANKEINILKLTPSHLKILRDSEETKLPLEDSIKKLIVGGEQLSSKLANDIYNKFNGRVEIYNEYGPTEATVGCMIYKFYKGDTFSYVPIGNPINNNMIYILNESLKPVSVGETGEIYISGDGLARGYIRQEILTKQRFIASPIIKGERMYKTGDLATRYLNGKVLYKGRIDDDQVKIRGYRIELGEIEFQLTKHDQINEAVVLAKENGEDKYLIAYYVSEKEIEISELKDHLMLQLPRYMIPTYFIYMKTLPLTSNGKLNKKSLLELELDNKTDENYGVITNEVEEKLLKVWSELLGHNKISIYKNFFDAGGDSLKVITLGGKINRIFNVSLSITDLFDYPNISSQANFIRKKNIEVKLTTKENINPRLHEPSKVNDSDIAIVGMAGRFPGADNIETFWENLKSGKESITRKDNMNDSLVYAKGFLKDYDLFDSSFFDYTPMEAQSMDPQIRIFHECVWEALENAGYNPFKYEGLIGLYGGASPNPYYDLSTNKNNGKDFFEEWATLTYADKDFLCPRVSYKLNLRGPSVNISTACSTSLVAVDTACNDLLANKCDIAMAGGISVTLHDNDGYVYRKDMILSPDGRCRAFDSNSAGTVGGNGVGVIVLKRFKDALQDQDYIHAVIKSTAINNDGNQKVGFTAPSIEGQSKVINKAIKRAGIKSESISYIEAHGTGTSLGDPIEIAGLKKAFNTEKKLFCAIGSVKTNIGHLDSAAGVAGIIKTILALKNKQIPPSIHFKRPNPKIDFANSPFYVNTSLKKWESAQYPRRAGVSSFGIGGTNAHVIIEEAPIQEVSSESREFQMIVLSAKTSTSLNGYITKLMSYFSIEGGHKLSDIAYTLQKGREHFAFRKMIVCENHQEVIESLSSLNMKETKPVNTDDNKLFVFMFSGQGSQYINMCVDLYEKETSFKEIVNNCFEIVKKISGKDLKRIIFTDKQIDGLSELDNTEFAQPALFIIEYALAQLLIKWGVQPGIMIGHSIGEYVAACISGVFSLEDALTIVIKRGELMQKARRGSMLSISISKDKLMPFLKANGAISLASINSSELCVVSGTEESIKSFKHLIEAEGYENKIIRTSHAFHSFMMDEILPEYEKVLYEIKINPQQVPFISNLTGKEALDTEISSPQYWVNHLRHAVKFSEGIQTILKNKNALFIEFGPGNTLTTFVRSNRHRKDGHRTIHLVRHPKQQTDDLKFLLNGVGKLWLNGVGLNWDSFYSKEQRKKVPLPTYSFEKTRYAVKTGLSISIPDKREVYNDDSRKWFHALSWERSMLINGRDRTEEKKCNLIFIDNCDIGQSLKEKLEQNGQKVTCVMSADSFKQRDKFSFEINAEEQKDYYRLFEEIKRYNSYRVIFAWGLNNNNYEKITIDQIKKSLNIGFYSLLNIARAINSKQKKANFEIFSITNNADSVLNTDHILPEKSLLLGALKVIPKEYSNIKCSNIDITLSERDEDLIQCLLHEIESDCHGDFIAYRFKTRFIQTVRPIKLPQYEVYGVPFTSGNVYLITGGIGGMGLSFTKNIAADVEGVNLVLLGRKKLPQKNQWKVWLNSESQENPLYSTIKDLQSIEDKGGKVYYFSVDIADKRKLKKIIADVETKLGPVRGVIHTAGEADNAGFINRRRVKDDEKIFAAKLYGTVILYDTLSSNNLDFFILCSSLDSVNAPFGQVGYVAANMFLDSFSRYSAGMGNTDVTSIGWNAWREVGMSANAAKKYEEFNIPVNSISSEEGYKILLRSIRSKLPGLIISKATLSTLPHKADTKLDILLSEKENQMSEYESVGKISDTALSGAYDEILLKLWKEFFGSPEISIDDDFFELGGDSLMALRMIGRIYKTLNFELSIAVFFENPTIRQLNDYINSVNVRKNNGKTSDRNEHSLLRGVEKRSHYLISSVQKGLFFLHEFDKSSIAYNMPLAFELEGEVEKSKLNTVFRKLIQRHESLRTCFEIIDDKPFQKVLQQVDFEIKGYKSNGSEDKTIRDFIKPFNLRIAPLIRVGLIDVSKGKHILIVDLHHIITDGTSKNVLITDFMALYNNEDLPPLKLHYKDYAVWQQSKEQQERIALQKDFWIKEFFEETVRLDLPTDFSRPPFKSYEGDALEFKLNYEVTNKLRVMSESEGTTLFMVLLSIYNILLAKLSKQEDIVVGVPVAGRQHADLDKIIGVFVKILPMRSYPMGNLTFKEFLANVKSKTLECFDHQEYPYEELVEELKVERDTSRNTLFDTVFFYQNFEQSTFKIPGLNIKPYNENYSAIDYDINLTVFERDGQLTLTFEYATTLFKKESILRFINYFKKIVLSVLKDVNTKIEDIDILPDHERNQLLYEFNNTQTELNNAETFANLFKRQAEKTPLSIAVEHGKKKLTYEELYLKSAKISSYFISKGVKANKKVVLFMSRRIEMLTCIIATFQSGGVYIPLDVEYPKRRIKEILLDCEAGIIVTTHELLGLIDEVKQEIPSLNEVICIDRLDQLKVETIKMQAKTSLEDLAYMIYTSGTTGKPKGVMIHQLGMINHLYAKISDLGLNARDVIAQTASASFDISIWQFLAGLMVGGKTCIIDKEIVMEPYGLLKALQQNAVTVFESVPSLITIFLDELMEKEIGSLLYLRWMIMTGESLNMSLVKKWYSCFPNVKVLNAYGPTEASDDVTHHVVEYFGGDDQSVPIGKPIQNINIYVLDSSLRLCPIRVKGEIYVAGLGVGIGYWKDEIKTQVSFLSNPFIQEIKDSKYTRLYKTGDMGYYQENGEIICMGRIDDQVKIRGFRVELGEIESHLSTYDLIKEAVVIVKSENKNKHLVAYYISDEYMETEVLKKYLSNRLPEYMIPSFYVRLEKIPLTSNGKLDKKNLPNPGINVEEVYIAPKTKQEKLLAKIWSSALGVEHISITDNFFSVGGDSIKSIQISARMRRAGYDVSVKDIFTNQTIRDLSSKLRKIILESDQSVVTGKSALTPIQRMYFENSAFDRHHFNQSVMLNFTNRLSQKVVGKIFKKLQEHHDALRTVFEEEDGVFLQRTCDLDLPLSMEVRDLTKEKDPVAALLSIANKIQSGFNLEQGPLMKIGLFHLTDGSRLLIVIHHLVVDGISWRILFEDIEFLYQQILKNRPLSLPLKTDSFQSWSSHLAEYIESKRFREAMDYWDDHLNKESVPIVTDYPSGIYKNQDNEEESFKLGKKETFKLLTEAHIAFGTQINDILLAGLLISVNKQYGNKSVKVDIEGHGREHIKPGVNIARTIGWFTSLYPVLLEGVDESLSIIIKQVKETLRRVPNNGIDYLLYKHLKSEGLTKSGRSRNRSQIIFNYLGQFDSDTEGNSYSIAQEPKGIEVSLNKIRQHDWEIWGMVVDGQLEISLTYSKKQFKKETICTFTNFYKESLLMLINHCSTQTTKKLTPSDLSYKALSIPQVDDLQRQYSVEDIYPLSPMQEGMLFHSLLDPDSGEYFEQMTFQMNGDLDPVIVEKCINDLIVRYGVLRTMFLHEGYQRPLQVVLKERKVNFSYKDIQKECLSSSMEEVFELYRLQDSSGNFNLKKDVLVRVSMFKTAKDKFQFIWSHHHILMDGWCVGIIIREFREVYSKYKKAQKITLKPINKYSQYIDWLEKQDNERSGNYWKGYLASYEQLVSLPKREVIEKEKLISKKKIHQLTIDGKLTRLLHKVSRQNRVTLNTILQVAWGILLSKYNNTDDVVFGSVVSGRPAEIDEIENMVGLFINTIPVRIRCNNDYSITNLLQKVQDEALESEIYQYYPLAEIQSMTGLSNTLLDHLMIFLNHPIADEIENPAYGKYDEDVYTISNVKMYEQTNYDLLVLVTPKDETYIKFEYNISIYQEKLIEQVSGHLKNILEQIVSNCDQKVASIDILSEDEKHQLLYKFNETKVSYPKGRTIVELFDNQARKTPYNIALRYGDETVNYLELKDISDKMASYLIEFHDIKPGDLVGLILKREEYLVSMILGIMKAGAAYVPIDANYPFERINMIIDDAKPKILITRTNCLNSPLNASCKIVNLDETLDTINDCQISQLDVEIGRNDLSYVIYTSGSTGKPKGVMIKHSSLVNYSSWAARNYVKNEKSAFPLFTSISFDLTITSIFIPLVTGNEIVIYGESEKKLPIENVVTDNRVEIMKLTPSHLKIIRDGRSWKSFAKTRIKILIVGGEELELQLAKDIYQKFGENIEIYNEYGPTEATVGCMIQKFDPESGLYSVPIGKPINNTQIYLLDRFLKPVPMGVNGELFISGDGLAKGYMAKRVLTKQKFVNNPFVKGERMYKTGDVASRLPDGSIVFKGRADDQIKIRGFRIELGEIKNLLVSHQLINEAVVIAKQEVGEIYLIGYYVAERELEASALKTFLLTKLPNYMVPSYYVHLQDLPLTSNGKLDRKAFPKPETMVRDEYRAPSNVTEEKLVEIWSEVLNMDKELIGVNSSFFELGGHSIKVLSLVNKIFLEFNVEVLIYEVFKHQNIRNLSKFILEADKAVFSSIKKVEQKKYYKLSSTQERLYFLYEFDKTSLAYNMPEVMRLEGKIDKRRLSETFNRLINRHESLRTSFEIFKDDCVQKISGHIDLVVEYFQSKKEEVHSVIQQFVRPFDLKHPPLIRVGLIEIAAQEHLLMIDIHHIITDGISNNILIREFMALYNNEELPELELQYKDFAEWQQSEKQQEKVAKQRDFWIGEYVEEPTTLELPTDFERPVIKSYEGASLDFVIGVEETSRLKSLAETEGTTPFVVLLSIYTILLSKLANQEDIVVGTVAAGRPHNDFENIIGMFVNTLPLRNYPRGDLSFKEYLSYVKTKTLACLDNQAYQYEELIDELNVVRDTSHNPLFDVTFVYQNFDGLTLEIPELILKPCDNEHLVSKFDLSLIAVDAGGKFHMSFEYATGLFKKETVERFINYFSKIVSRVVSGTNTIISKIEILSEEEKLQLLHEFNNAQVAYPTEETIIYLFEKQVKKTPGNIALIYNNVQISYKNLNERANQLARYLKGKGVKEESVVGVMLERSIEMIIGIIGILKANGTYLPLDCNYPEKRILHMLHETEAMLLLTKKNNVEIYSQYIHTVDIGDIKISAKVKKALRTQLSPSSVAYVIYTSGSTGRPKGVMVQHRAIVNLILSQKNLFGMVEQDKVLQFSTISFDASIEQIWLALLSGSALVLIGKDLITDSIRFNNYISIQSVTHLHATPSFLESIELDKQNTLKRIVSGGEQCKLQLASRFSKDYKFYNEYGPTETTVTSTVNQIFHEDINRSVIPIGRPINNTLIYILDSHMNLMPKSGKGELYIGGEGLAKGYVKNEELTNNKFIDNPFLANGKVYKTGDLARWLPDGNIEFLGRKDDQVKLRGFRIELGEVESCLLEHELVNQAVVVAEGKMADKCLVAYFVANKEVEVSTLRNHLSKKLPEYMLPSYFVHIEDLPLTPNGKIDRKALPELKISVGEEYEEPSNEIEEKLLEIWLDVLKMDEALLNVNESFFNLGGNSLGTMKLVNKILKEFNVEVPVDKVFKYQNIRDLSKFIIEARKASFSSIKKAEQKKYYTLSSAQKRLYFLYEFDKTSLAYNMPRIMRLEGEVDEKRLGEIFCQLIIRHESLRTAFIEVDGGPVQVIVEQLNFEVEFFNSSEEGAPAKIREFIRPFNLSKAPLIRVGLINISSTVHILMVDIHHIISDGVSDNILVKEFMSLYNNEELPELALQYKDFAEWQQSGMQQEKLSRHRDFWMNEYVEETATLELPIDFPRPAMKSYAGDIIDFEISRELTSKLKSLANDEGATVYMVLLSVYTILLGKLANQEDIVVGTPVAGRQHDDLEGIIGMFANTLPLRNYPRGGYSFKEFLSAVKSKFLACFDNQAYPYEDLVDELRVKRDLSRNPLFDAMFAYENFEKSKLKIPGLIIMPYDYKDGVSKFDQTLTVYESGDRLLLSLEYSTKLFTKKNIRRFLDYFKKIVFNIIENIDIKISNIEIISEGEKYKLMKEFNNTVFEYPQNETIISLFEKQVKKTPKNKALVYENETISYEELNDKADLISFRINNKISQRRNLKIGLLFNPSIEMIASILGVLKSSCAYVPLAPNVPAERNNYIISDCEICLLLIHKVLCEEKYADDLLIEKEKVIVIGEIQRGEARPDRFRKKTFPKDLINVIYTSGSTGQPKGVEVNHQGIVNYTLWRISEYKYVSSDITLQLSPYNFDTYASNLYSSLLSGGTLVIISEENKLNAKFIVEVIRKEKVSNSCMTPGFYNLILNEIKNNQEFEYLRFIVLAGEKANNRLLRKSESELPKVTLYNEYGPTEASVAATYNEGLNIYNASIIGKPIYNTKIFVLGKSNELLPIGTSGELCIGGVGLTRGYLNREELTADKFIENPKLGGERVYKTGDLAKWLPDGNLEFLGRIDNQVKIRGFRIELGEIENQLIIHDKIKESVVITQEKEDDKYIVAYYVSEEELEMDELRSFMSDKLPNYMMPTFYVHLESLPLMPNGKLNKKALPNPELNMIDENAMPINQTQKELVEIWAEVLGQEACKIGVNRNFFEIGGNSLKLANMVNKVNQQFNSEISVTDVFRFSTIHSLAEFMSKKKESKPDETRGEGEDQNAIKDDLEKKNEAYKLFLKLRT